MRAMQSDLAILNAAQYEDGVPSHRGHAASAPMKTPHAPLDEPPSRKRPRTVSTAQPAQAEHEEEKRRARGRPRLDPKDQTPQDVSHVASSQPRPLVCLALRARVLFMCLQNHLKSIHNLSYYISTWSNTLTEATNADSKCPKSISGSQRECHQHS